MRPLRTSQIETRLRELVAKGALSLGPVTFALEQGPAGELLRVKLEGNRNERRFAFHCKANWTLKSLAEAAQQLREKHGPKVLPLLVTPYLSERALAKLAEQKISALDLCGNGLLVAPPNLLILRSGAKDTTRSASLPIYDASNVSTLVPRVLFSEHAFPTATAMLEACHARMMPLEHKPLPLTLPTVSKALRELDDELITGRRGRKRYLRDPVRLLEHLQRSFRLPPAQPVQFKTTLSVQETWARLHDLRPRSRFVVTGRGSAVNYVGLAGPERLQLYVSDLVNVQQALEAKSTRAFPNLELTQTDDEAPYFDAREQVGVLWSSPLQCYLELTRIGSDPREQDVAERLRAKLVDGAESGRE
jgi:hypothetical protein